LLSQYEERQKPLEEITQKELKAEELRSLKQQGILTKRIQLIRYLSTDREGEKEDEIEGESEEKEEHPAKKQRVPEGRGRGRAKGK
jgi:hypothetical protein